MSQNPALKIAFAPGVRVLIPFLYAGWSDRVLTPSEVHTLRERVAQLSFLTKPDKQQLLLWSNPAIPPTRDLFKFWEISCQEVAAQLPPDQQTLLAVGLALAASETPRQHWMSAQDRASLQALETDLGQLNVATFRNLFNPPPAAIFEEEARRASFRVTEMQTLLDGRMANVKAKTLTILQDPEFQLRHIPIKEDHREQVLKWCQLLARQGMGSLSFPSAYGGQDDLSAYAAVFETLGYHDLSLCIKFGVQFGLWGGSVFNLGTAKHHEKYLPATGTLDLPGCFAMTETGHGSNVRALETTATYDPDTGEFIVHSPREEAGKEYIGNALHSRVASVFAQLIVGEENHGVHALVVPLRDTFGELLPGIRVQDNGYKLGLNGVDNGRIWFNHVRVPRENLLDRFGQVAANGTYSSPIENPSRRFFTMLGTLVGGRVCVPRAGLSATKKALDIAIRYGAKRRQFSPTATSPETPILDYPSHQRRLLPLVAKAYAVQFGLDHLADRYFARTDDTMREIETLAAGMKAYATWFTTAAIQECREACGGKGYLTENQFAALKADTEIFTTFEGDNTVLMQLVAKGLLTDYQQAFHEDGNMAIMRMLGERISTVVTEQNPFTIRNTEASHLRSAEFQLSAFQFRERRLLFSLAQRLRGHIKNGESAYQAGLICQTHMLALAEAFVERVTLEAMHTAIQQQRDKSTFPILEQLRALYALHTIEQHAAWYLEQDYLANVKSKAIRRQIDQLCSQLRPEALALVEAFGIPDALLAAPIAL
ncbi:MAG: acyl-CoA oxidase [Bacteroidetes bacterium]|nr:MAG: acyl-CoA oxidase [Bacteroidota bacterium]